MFSSRTATSQHRNPLSVPALKAALPTRFKLAGRQAFLRVAAVLNAGSRVSCPCCGRRFRKFARFHGLNDQCPGCGSLMRHRAIALYVRNVLRVAETGGRALAIGPSRPEDRLLESIDSLEYVSVGLDPALADVQADVIDLPFDDESFDLVWCMHVLEHVPDDRKAISELFRVLRPGSQAVIQVPPSPFEETLEDPTVTDPRERERLFGQFDHVRLCGADYRDRLEAPGFEVTLEDYPAQLDLATRAAFEIHAGEPFYLCVKPAPPRADSRA